MHFDVAGGEQYHGGNPHGHGLKDACESISNERSTFNIRNVEILFCDLSNFKNVNLVADRNSEGSSQVSHQQFAQR